MQMFRKSENGSNKKTNKKKVKQFRFYLFIYFNLEIDKKLNNYKPKLHATLDNMD